MPNYESSSINVFDVTEYDINSNMWECVANLQQLSVLSPLIKNQQSKTLILQPKQSLVTTEVNPEVTVTP